MSDLDLDALYEKAQECRGGYFATGGDFMVLIERIRELEEQNGALGGLVATKAFEACEPCQRAYQKAEARIAELEANEKELQAIDFQWQDESREREQRISKLEKVADEVRDDHDCHHYRDLLTDLCRVCVAVAALEEKP